MTTALEDQTAWTYDYHGLTVRLVQDTEPAVNPRKDYDTPSTWYGEGGESSWAGGYCSAAEWIREKRLEGSSVIPVRYADYGSGGARLYETDMDDANGAFICDRATIEEEWGTGRGKFKGTSGARNYMRGEIKEMDLWLQGHSYGIVIEDEAGEVAESVWGFIGEPDSDWIVDEARDMAESVRASIVEDQAKEHRESLWAAVNGIPTTHELENAR